MKGRFRAGLLFSLTALLSSSFSAFPQNTGPLLEHAIKAGKDRPARRQARELKRDGVYVIRKGDSLYAIARAFHTTPEALRTANNLPSDRIQIGQRLRVPSAGDTAAASAGSRAAKPPLRGEGRPEAPGVPAQEQPRLPSNEGTYVVEKGDNLSRIARIFNTTPKALMAANGLRSTRLKIGQELQLPAAPSATSSTAERILKEPQLSPEGPTVSAALSRPMDPRPTEDAASEPRRVQVVRAGFELLGVRYKYGGSSKKSGFDCSGLVKELFSKVDIELPRSSREQFRQGEKVNRDELEVGDLVFFSSGGKQPSHVGIYIGDNKFLHAARKARQVIISDLNKLWYNMRYIGARRITDLWKDDPDSGIPAE
jgi:cell wall-associated NlpC family hydrolase